MVTGVSKMILRQYKKPLKVTQGLKHELKKQQGGSTSLASVFSIQREQAEGSREDEEKTSVRRCG